MRRFIQILFVLFFVVMFINVRAEAFTISLTQGLSELGINQTDPENQIGRVTLSISDPMQISAATVIVDTTPFPVKRVDMINTSFSLDPTIDDHKVSINLQRISDESDQNDILKIIIDNSSKYPSKRGFGDFVFEKVQLVSNDGSRIEDVKVVPGSWFFFTDVDQRVPMIVTSNYEPISDILVLIDGFVGAPGIVDVEWRTDEEGRINIPYPLADIPREQAPPIQIRIRIKNPITQEGENFIHDAIHNLQYNMEKQEFEEISIEVDLPSKVNNWIEY